MKREDPRGELGRRANHQAKRGRGATSTADTPLDIRSSGTVLEPATRTHVAKRLGRQLTKYALLIERVTVRFTDANGPRGGIDQVCTIKVVLSGFASIVTEARAREARAAFDEAAQDSERAVRRTLQRAERGQPRAREANEQAPERPAIPRRDTDVGTAASTARRNLKTNVAGMTAALEGSATGKPSRKSTRGSANRARQGTELSKRQTARATSPTVRAGRAKAGRGAR